jgi:hypothetical protein
MEGVRLAICDVTSATNTRTMLATWVPRTWRCGNTAPVLVAPSPINAFALLAVLNSMTFDWILRRIAAGLHLNRFYLEATPLPCLAPEAIRELAAFGFANTDGPRVRALSQGDSIVELPTSDDPDVAGVEALVASGYGLSSDMLRRVLSDDPADRKGLWRYFASEPAAVAAARESIRRLEAA